MSEIIKELFGELIIKDLDSNIIFSNTEKELTFKSSIRFENKERAYLFINQDHADHLEVAHALAPLLHGFEQGHFERNCKILAWLKEVKAMYPEIFDWVGIYFKSSFLLGEDNTDLVLGPFLGESTEHQRISLDKGFCGMALREERVLNISDVTQDETHIACSLKTRSELVIPLENEKGELIAELDIDSNQLGAFSLEIEAKVKEYCLTFSNNFRSL